MRSGRATGRCRGPGPERPGGGQGSQERGDRLDHRRRTGPRGGRPPTSTPARGGRAGRRGRTRGRHACRTDIGRQRPCASACSLPQNRSAFTLTSSTLDIPDHWRTRSRTGCSHRMPWLSLRHTAHCTPSTPSARRRRMSSSTVFPDPGSPTSATRCSRPELALPAAPRHPRGPPARAPGPRCGARAGRRRRPGVRARRPRRGRPPP